MKYRWARNGPKDTGTWHLVDEAAWGITRAGRQGGRALAECGVLVSKLNFVYGDDSGWTHIRKFPAGLCFKCIDLLTSD